MELAAPRGIKVLEDAAQAHGARLGGRMAGALGDAATFSFFLQEPRRLRDGGAVVSSDPEVEAIARRLRFHGSEDKRTYTDAGYNSRLDDAGGRAAGAAAAHGRVDRAAAPRRRATPTPAWAPTSRSRPRPREARAAGICSWSARPSATASPSGCRPPPALLRDTALCAAGGLALGPRGAPSRHRGDLRRDPGAADGHGARRPRPP